MRLGATKTGATTTYNGLGDQLYDLGGARPTLDLNFANNESLVDSVTGKTLVTFTRASSATYVDGDGIIQTAGNNVARFDHDPITGESLGLLVEGNRTNLVPYSVATKDDWSPSGGTSTDLSLNALGVFPGVRTSSGGQTYHGLNTTTFSGFANDTTYTATIWFRAGDTNPSNKLRLIFRNNTEATVSDISKTSASTDYGSISSYTANDASAGTATSSLTVLSVETMADGLTYKLVASFVVEGASTDQYKFGIQTGSATIGETIIALGMQIEQGDFATSYIPTSGSSATRSPDVASITGTNFSSWYNQTEGTVFSNCSLTYQNSSGGTTHYQFSDGTTGERFEVFGRANGGTGFRLYDGGTELTNVSPTTNAIPANTAIKIAVAIKENDIAAKSFDDKVLQTDNSATLPTVDRLSIGNGAVTTFALSGTISRLTYWPKRLSDDTLQQITS